MKHREALRMIVRMILILCLCLGLQTVPTLAAGDEMAECPRLGCGLDCQVERIPNSCTETGAVYYICPDHGRLRVSVIPISHNFREVDGSYVAATCVTEGTVDQKCAKCGAEKTASLEAALGHTLVSSAQCWQCLTCGKVFTDKTAAIEASSGSIRVERASARYGYKASRVFLDTENGLTADPAWQTILKNSGATAAYAGVDENGSITLNMPLGSDTRAASAFAQNAMKAESESTEKAIWTEMTVEDNVATALYLDDGWYIVDTDTVGLGDPDIADSAVLTRLSRASESAVITEKPEAPSVEKYIQTATVLGFTTEESVDKNAAINVDGTDYYPHAISDAVSYDAPAQLMLNASKYSVLTQSAGGGVINDAGTGLSFPYLPGGEKTAFGKNCSLQAGDEVWYMLRVRIPSPYIRNLKIIDTLGAGLTYLTDSAVAEGSDQCSIGGINTGGFWAERANGMGPVAGAEKGAGTMTVSSEQNAEGATVVTIALDDKAVQDTAENEGYVFFWYKARINENASLLGEDAAANTARITYDGQKEDDPGSTVSAYMYDADLSKLDGQSDSKKQLLPGAQFRMFYYDDETPDTPIYVTFETEAAIGVRQADGERSRTDTAAGFAASGATTNPGDSALIDMAEAGMTRIAGLKAGRAYYLEETAAPEVDGVQYEKLSSPLVLEVIPARDAQQNLTGTASLRIDGNAATGAPYATLDAEKAGWESGGVAIVNDIPLWSLPSTGGSGTLALYIIGGSVIATALIALIIKKRRKTSNAV